MSTGLITSIILFLASLFLFIRFPGFLVGKLMREPGRSLPKRVFEPLLAAILFCILPIKTMVSILTSFFLLGLFVLLILNIKMIEMRKNRIKGMIGTVIFHAIIILLLIFFGFSTPLPLPGEEGVEVSLGTNDQGFGPIQPEIPAQI